MDFSILWTHSSNKNEKSGSRNLVAEIWLQKSSLRKVVDQKKKVVVLCYKSTFFWFEKSGWPEKKIRVCRTTFLEPLFHTFREKWLQNKWSIVWFKAKVVKGRPFHICRRRASWLVKWPTVFKTCWLSY